MSKVTMPEPVEQQIRYFDSNALSRTYGEWSEWKMFTGKYERMGMNQKRGLITTDQAEAYADARVREALEKAESIVRRNADACFSFVVKAMLHSNADAIRALLAERDALRYFAESFVEAWEEGMGGDSSLYRQAKTALAQEQGEQE